MRQVAIATLVSVFWAEWLEFWYRFGATDDPQAFWGATAPYALIALAFHIILQLAPRLPRWLWFWLGALPGMALEWVAIGNSPWGNPDASQVGMVLFHGSWPIWGRILDPDWFGPRLRRAGLLWMAGWSVALAPGFMLPPGDLRFAVFLWLPLVAYLGLAVMVVTGRPRDAAGPGGR